MGWYTTIEDSVVANKDYVYEEGDLLETHWIFEECITNPLRPSLPYALLTEYTKDYYLQIKSVLTSFPEIGKKIKEEIEEKKDLNTYITSFSPNPGEDPDPTEVVEEESDSDSIDSEDSDYIDDYLYINDEENIINDLNEKIKEGIANKAIVVDFINERMGAYIKQYDDNEKLYLLRFRDLLRLYNREGFLYNSNINVDENAYWIIDVRQDRLGKNIQYIYNYNYTNHEENVYREDMIEEKKENYTQLLSTLKKGDIDQDIVIGDIEEKEDALTRKNTFHNLNRYIDGYKYIFSSSSSWLQSYFCSYFLLVSL